MLNPTQLQKLEEHISHPTYGPLLKKSISTWSTTDCRAGVFGLRIKKENNIDIFTEDHIQCGCCLIGASLVEKEICNQSVAICCALIYNLSAGEVFGLIRGFDDAFYPSHKGAAGQKSNNHAYNFAFSIGLIVFSREGETHDIL